MGARSMIGVRWWGARAVKREPYRWGTPTEIRWIPMEPEPNEPSLWALHRASLRELERLFGVRMPVMGHGEVK